MKETKKRAAEAPNITAKVNRNAIIHICESDQNECTASADFNQLHIFVHFSFVCAENEIIYDRLPSAFINSSVSPWRVRLFDMHELYDYDFAMCLCTVVRICNEVLDSLRN